MKTKLLLTTAIVGMTFISNASASDISTFGDLSIDDNTTYTLTNQNITADAFSSGSNTTLNLNNVSLSIKDTNTENFVIGDGIPTRSYFENSTNFRINENNEIEYSATPNDANSWNVINLGDTTPSYDTIVSGGVTLQDLGGIPAVNEGLMTMGSTTLNIDGNVSINTDGNVDLTGAIFNAKSGTLTINANQITGTTSTFNVLSGATVDTKDTITNSVLSLNFSNNSSFITNIENSFTGINAVADVKNANIFLTVTKAQLFVIEAGMLPPTPLSLGTALNGVNVVNNRLTGFAVDQTTGNITFTGAKSAAEVVMGSGVSTSVAGAATFWDGITGASNQNMQDVADALFTLSQSDGATYASTLEMLGPVASAMTQSLSLTNFEMLKNAAFNRGENEVYNMGSGDVTTEKGSLWVQGLYDMTSLDDTNKAKGFDADSYGIAVGADFALSDTTIIGMAYSYLYSDVDGGARQTEVDTNTIALYSSFKQCDFYINGLMAYGFGSYDESKTVLGTGYSNDYDANSFGMEVSIGQNYDVGGFTLTPEAGVRYINIEDFSYTDSLGQTAQVDAIDVFTALVGVKASATYVGMGMNWKPEVKFGLSYDLYSDGPNAVVGSSLGSYSIAGEELSQFAIDFGVGIMTEITENFDIGVSYEGQYRSDYFDNTGLIKARYNF